MPPRSHQGRLTRNAGRLLAAALLTFASIVSVGWQSLKSTRLIHQNACPATTPSAPSSFRVYTGADLGVQRIRIPGELNSTGDIVVLHLWIRQKEDDGRPSLVGFGFMELLSEVRFYVGNALLQPQEGIEELSEPGFMRLYALHGELPIAKIQLSPLVDSEDGHHAMGRPFWFDAPLPPRGTRESAGVAKTITYELRISNWRRFAHFTMPTSEDAEVPGNPLRLLRWPTEGWLRNNHVPPPPLDLPSTRVVFVLKPPYNADAKALALMVGHIMWHREALGVDGYLVYIFPELVEAIAANPYLVEFQREGYVQFILWDQEAANYMISPRWQRVPGVLLNNRTNSNFVPPKVQQLELRSIHEIQSYNHALLLTTGKGVTLMIGDIDEFIATPTPKSAAQIVTECLANNATSAILLWRLIMCGDCPGKEIDAWTTVYSTTRNSGVPALSDHPLRRYWISSNDSYRTYGKSIVVPERTRSYRHHEGIAVSGGRHESRPKCDAELLHAKSLFANRPFDAQRINNTAWQWPFLKEPKLRKYRK